MLREGNVEVGDGFAWAGRLDYEQMCVCFVCFVCFVCVVCVVCLVLSVLSVLSVCA